MSNLKGTVILMLFAYAFVIGIYICSEMYNQVYTGNNILILISVILCFLGALAMVDDE